MTERTTCVVVGGGPAGMVTALLLARAGVGVVVLEKHTDFLRDFRGDTVHPTTLQLLDELGLSREFERLPQTRVDHVEFPTRRGGYVVTADFRRLRLAHPYIAMVPQWDFLDLLASAGARERSFELRMGTEVVGLLRSASGVAGVRYRDRAGEHGLRADLTVVADGRDSVLPAQAGLASFRHRVGLDVWWFRVPFASDLPVALLPRSANGRLFVAFPRRGYLQVAGLIPKGADGRLRAEGVEALRSAVSAAIPEVRNGVDAIHLADVKLLEVQLTRLTRWWARGLLCIGDAAHAMSPIGGIGINLAVQDGVAAAALVAKPLRAGRMSDRVVAGVQARRRPPAVATQLLQRLFHLGVDRVVAAGRPLVASRAVRELLRFVPPLAALPALLLTEIVRPESTPGWARRPAAGERAASTPDR